MTILSQLYLYMLCSLI